jgi:hypothetical protein
LYNSHSFVPNLNSFCFINKSKLFGKRIDWEYSAYGRLWTYNLNYFEFLNQQDINELQGRVLIDNYIKDITNRKTGMEPYPLSLRIMNWVKFFSRFNIHDTEYNSVLYSQSALLSKKIEYHLLGNHLLENGFALLWSAYFFGEYKFYNIAKKILIKELNEQVLDDGAHFELSPMYHSVMLLRVLDSINIVSHSNQFGREMLKLLLCKASIMLGWLEQICFNNGELPLLNDSAMGVAPSLYDLRAYALCQGIIPVKNKLHQSGYRKLSNNFAEVVVDIGEIGPKYQPGHAHADTLSFELFVGNRLIITDTGTSMYEAGNERSYERSTFAHNTVVVNNLSSSQIWGAHRVANRAHVNVINDEKNLVVASHDGYKKYVGEHRRVFKLNVNELIIEDSIRGNGCAYLHFAPGIKVEITGNVLNLTNTKIAVSFIDVIKIEKLKSKVATEFNRLIESTSVRIQFKNDFKTVFTF